MSIRYDVVKLALAEPALRADLLAILKEAGSYQDYVERKKRDHEEPLKKDEWEARVNGKGKDDKGKDDKDGEKTDLKSKVKSFLDRFKGVPNKMADSVRNAPEKVQKFVVDPETRKESVQDMAKKIKASPKKIVGAIKSSAKKELHELEHAVHAVKKVLQKPPQQWTKQDVKAVYAAAVYVAGAAVAGAGGGPLIAAGMVGKSFALHVGIKAMHQVLDDGFLHFEAVETVLHALHFASEDEVDPEDALIASLTAAVAKVLAKGISDADMEAILKGVEEPDMDSFKEPKQAKGNTDEKKEASLRSAVIRLAHARPELRPHLLPLVKNAFGDGTYVLVNVLPPVVQRALRELGYGRRDIRVTGADKVTLQDPGGDGYQGFACVINMGTEQYEIMRGSWGGANPWSKSNPVDMDDRRHTLPPNGAVIKGHRGGGKPVYATLYVHPDTMPALIPQKPDLTNEEAKALAIINGLKPGYRADSFDRYGLGMYTKDNPILQSLAQKGLVKATGAGIQITIEGKNAVDKSIRVY